MEKTFAQYGKEITKLDKRINILVEKRKTLTSVWDIERIDIRIKHETENWRQLKNEESYKLNKQDNHENLLFFTAFDIESLGCNCRDWLREVIMIGNESDISSYECVKCGKVIHVA